MNKYIIYIMSTLLLTSCFRERIELDLNEDNQKLIVNAWITDLDEPQFVSLSKSVNFLGSEQVEFVSGATITLSDETSGYSLVEGTSGQYFLPSDWQPKVGDIYTLEVDYENIVYSATHVMRSCPDIESINYKIDEDDAEKDSIDLYRVYGSFQDPVGKGDAYYIIDYQKGTMQGDSLVNGFFAEDEFFDGEYLDDVTVTETDRRYELGDTAIVEFYAIGKETSEYLLDILNEVNKEGPFAPPPANIRTNLSNGALGYFIISEAKRYEVIIE